MTPAAEPRTPERPEAKTPGRTRTPTGSDLQAFLADGIAGITGLGELPLIDSPLDLEPTYPTQPGADRRAGAAIPAHSAARSPQPPPTLPPQPARGQAPQPPSQGARCLSRSSRSCTAASPRFPVRAASATRYGTTRLRRRTRWRSCMTCSTWRLPPRLFSAGPATAALPALPALAASLAEHDGDPGEN